MSFFLVSHHEEPVLLSWPSHAGLNLCDIAGDLGLHNFTTADDLSWFPHVATLQENKMEHAFVQSFSCQKLRKVLLARNACTCPAQCTSSRIIIISYSHIDSKPNSLLQNQCFQMVRSVELEVCLTMLTSPQPALEKCRVPYFSPVAIEKPVIP